MSNTRTARTLDIAAAPERHLSSLHLRPITVSLAITAQAVRAYPEPHRRAALWLANLAANSQRIQLCWQRRGLPDPLGTVGRIPEAALAAQLGLTPSEIYGALTGAEDADLPKFTNAVQAYRARFEANLPPLVRTEDTAIIEDAVACARDEHRLTVVSGKWRAGKTEHAEREWLRQLDRAVWLHCPSDNTERTFVIEFAGCLGISTGGGKKPAQMREQIKRALGIGLIDTVIIDEAHNLWPADIASAKPLRAEYVREITDSLGVGFVLVTTDQFALSLELAKTHNARWAPGQLLGRRALYTLRDTHTDAEIRAIARLHAGPIEPAAVDALRVFAQADEGYLGSMVLAAKAARRAADARAPGSPITTAEIALATRRQQTKATIVELAKTLRPNRRGRVPNIVPITTGRAA